MFQVLRRYWAFLVDMVTHYDVRQFELMGGLIALGWGVWLLNPKVLDPTQCSSFGLMRQMMPWPFWGMMFCGLGLLLLGALICGEPRWRKLAAMTAAVFWFFVSSFVLSSYRYSPDLPFLVMFTIGSTWGYWRIRVPPRKPNGANTSTT